MTLVEQEQLDAQARQRRIQRERIEGNIATSTRTLDTFSKEIQEKQRVVDQLRQLEALTLELPPQVAAKRSVIGSGGFGSATIPCVKTELISVLAGAIASQEVRLTNLEERRQAEALHLGTLKSGIREFQEAGA
jgi:hypothetical protein